MHGMITANRVVPCLVACGRPLLFGKTSRISLRGCNQSARYNRKIIASSSTQKRRSGSKNRAKTPDMPTPKEYQQTLQKSFTIGGVGFHTGDYAFVKVKPAFAGDGRYFVRVPKGTNANDYSAEKPKFVTKEQLDVAQGADDGLSPEERAQYFLKFLQEQDEHGYEGDFGEYLIEEINDDLVVESANDATIEEPTPRKDGEEWVPATINAAEIYGQVTSMLRNGDFYVMSPEAILSALEACGIDNARIEIEGGSEIPVADGSALTWALEIQKAGLREAPLAPGSSISTDRRAPAPKEIISVMGDDGAFISFYPGDDSTISAAVDFTKDASVVGRQWVSWKTSDSSPDDEYYDHYRWKIAPARQVFRSFSKVEEMFLDGLVQAGPDGCCLIAEGDSWYDPTIVRFANDEAARHTAQTMLGIMSLCASPGGRGLPVGHIVAFNPSPELELEFAKEFALQSKDYPTMVVHV